MNIFITSLFTPFRYLFKLVTRRPDVVHLNPSFDHKSLLREFSLILISRIAGIPVITQFHGGELGRVKRKEHLPFYIKLFLRWSSHLIVLTNMQRDPLLASVDADKISVIPNMIKTRAFRHNKAESKKFRVLFLSRMEAEKGIFDIYEAIPQILSKHPDLQVSFAGEGKDLQKLKEECRSKPWNGTVVFEGYICDHTKIDFLASGDVFLLPSHHKEGMPYSILEAMASGLPIIATTCGAIPEIIKDGENGFLIPPGRPDLIADRVCRLLSDHKLKERIAENNTLKAKLQFDENIVTRKFSDVYDEVHRLHNLS